MTDGRNQHEMNVSLMDDPACEVNLELSNMDDQLSVETHNASGPLAVEQTQVKVSGIFEPDCLIQDSDNDSFSDSYDSCRTGDDTVSLATENVTNEIAEFIVGLRRYAKNIRGRELSAIREERYRQLFSRWNTFLQQVQGESSTSAIVSSDINADINVFIRQEEQQGTQWTEVNKERIKIWLPRWNMFLQARADRILVTRLNLCLTIVGFLFYIVDMASDIGTSMYYVSNGQWGRALGTLALVYAAVIIHTGVKWVNDEIQCTGAVDWLRYVASSLVNWPDVKQYGALCLLDWKLYTSHVKNARLVPEWHERRTNVSYLKYSEGVCEACPQAILQLCLLVPDLYGVWTWTDYLRIAGASVSLCTAGSALVNWEKFDRIVNYIDLPLTELLVLHVWAVPVTVSRLLSVTLLVSVHPYWALAGVCLHLVLYGVYYCRTWGGCALYEVIYMCLVTILYFISPFLVAMSIIYRRGYHAVHLLGNTAATVVWALATPLVPAHPKLYAAIISFNAVMFAVGLVAMEVHDKYWPGSYKNTRTK